jgi:hypothetical protein
MKTVKNQQTHIKNGENFLNRGDLIKLAAVSPPPDRGITIQDMRSRMRVLDAIDKAGSGDIEFEDADFAVAKRLFEGFGWISPHKDLIDLADHLDELAKTK